MLKIDLHIHSNYVQKDHEGKLSPEEIIDKASTLKYDVLSFSEHADYHHKKFNALKTYYAFKDYAMSKNILLIPGFEKMVEGKHVLIYNYTKNIHSINTFKDLKKIKSNSTLIIAPHPFHIKPYCLGHDLINHIELFDAIEYCNLYTFLINPNIISGLVSKKYNKPLIAFSDTHLNEQFGKNYSLINSKKEISSIIDAIKQNKIKIVTKPLPIKLFTKIVFWSLNPFK